MTSAKQTSSSAWDEMDQFTLHGGCIFFLLVVCGSGGITAYLILSIAPWILDLPSIPIWLGVPFAVVGLAGPLIAFVLICKNSRSARRFFFKPPDDNVQSIVVKEPK